MMRISRSGVRLLAAAAAVGALLCCNLGPAWSPDGKALVFQFQRADKTSCLARFELESDKSAVVLAEPDWKLFSPTFAPDGELYSLAMRGEKETSEVVVLHVGRDGKSKTLASLGTKGDDKSSSIAAPFFAHAGHLWVCAPPPGAPKPEGGEGWRFTGLWVDPASGAITAPFPADRTIMPFGGAAGIFYVEPLRDADHKEAAIAVGRIELGADGKPSLAERMRMPGITTNEAQLVVGAHTLALLFRERTAKEEEPGEGKQKAWALFADVSGKELRRVELPDDDGGGPAAFGKDDERFWIATEKKKLLRIAVKDGTITPFDVDALAGVADGLSVAGLALAPKGSQLAIQLMPDDKAPGERPDLLLIDEAADSLKAKKVTAPR